MFDGIDFRCIVALVIGFGFLYFLANFAAPPDTREVMIEEVDGWGGFEVWLVVAGAIFLAALFVVIAFPELF